MLCVWGPLLLMLMVRTYPLLLLVDPMVGISLQAVKASASQASPAEHDRELMHALLLLRHSTAPAQQMTRLA